MVFRVPFPSSLATTSPATSEAISGRKKAEAQNRISTGVASPERVM